MSVQHKKGSPIGQEHVFIIRLIYEGGMLHKTPCDLKLDIAPSWPPTASVVKISTLVQETRHDMRALARMSV